MAEPAAGGSDRRGFWRVLLAGGAAAVLAAVASAKPWAHLSTGDRALVPSGAPELTGVGEVPVALALSLLVLAAWGAILVTRGRVRIGFAVVGLLASLGLLATAIRGAWSAPGDVRHALSADLFLTARAAANAEVTRTGWYWVALVAAVGCVLCCAVAVGRVPHWPTMSTRYDAPGSGSGPGAPATPRTQREWWKALDEGQDPTATPGEQSPGPDGDPGSGVV